MTTCLQVDMRLGCQSYYDNSIHSLQMTDNNEVGTRLVVLASVAELNGQF